MDVDITEEASEKVARELAGSAGLGGTDSHAIQHWLLRFGTASQKLCTVLVEFTNWMSNCFPPWPAFQALMAGRLVALDKCPGVCPLGVSENWRRAIAKTLLLVAGNEAKEACSIDHICAGLKAGIEGRH